ncbi:MAG: fumarylacetoacetate hydrolase family protein [Pseudomonadota bacterium]
MFRIVIAVVAVWGLISGPSHGASYARALHEGVARYGVVEGDSLQLLEGGLFPMSEKTQTAIPLSKVNWLPPTDPEKVFAVGKNFASHLSSRADRPPPLFLKLPSALAGHRERVVLPPDARNVHYEGELVMVVGKTAKNVSEAVAMDYIFGVTAGNDLSERSWQSSDLQWIRAKASDGFGPVGPVITTNLNITDLLLTTRLNGTVVQQESTANMIHSPAKVVSFLSRYFTLKPGDLIFMGTPGRTSALQDGDVVEVEIESVGILSNTIQQ